jgi:hypothetical protein
VSTKGQRMGNTKTANTGASTPQNAPTFLSDGNGAL